MTSKPYYMVSGVWTSESSLCVTSSGREAVQGGLWEFISYIRQVYQTASQCLTHWGKNESINRRSGEEWWCQPGPLHAWKHSTEHAKPMMKKTLTDHPVDSHRGFFFFFFLAVFGLPVWGLTEFPGFKGKAAETVLRARANPSHLCLN